MNKDILGGGEGSKITDAPVRQPKIIGNEAALRDAILEVAPRIASHEHIHQRVWPDVPGRRYRDRLLTVASSLREKLLLEMPPRYLVNVRGEGYIITNQRPEKG